MKIDKKYKWLARDKDGRLFSFSEKPFKNEEYKEWDDTGFHSRIEEKDERFSFIRWLDNEPIKISNIGNILALDSKDVYTSVNGVELTYTFFANH